MQVFLLCFPDTPSYFLVLAESAQKALEEKRDSLDSAGIKYGSAWCELATQENLVVALKEFNNTRSQMVDD